MRVIDLVPPGRERVYAVGRLDQSSEGLMLVTNDGQLANQVTHPRYGVRKTYQVLVAGSPSSESLERLLGGIHLAEGVAKVDRLEVKAEHGKSTMLEIVLSEGRNREIRRLLARVGHKVLRLRRIAVGGLRLKGLKSGEFRRLTRDEVDRLRSAVREPDPSRVKRSTGPRSAPKKRQPQGRGPIGGRPAGAGSRPRSPGRGAIVDDA
jgi:23S rRNA pseudouridine2605 synthase